MSETTATPAHAPSAAVPPRQRPMAAAEEKPKKHYDYVRVRLRREGGALTTISLDRKLVERATRALGSQEKALAVAQSAAQQYLEGQSPARSRSGFAARALQALLLPVPGGVD